MDAFGVAAAMLAVSVGLVVAAYLVRHRPSDSSSLVVAGPFESGPAAQRACRLPLPRAVVRGDLALLGL